MFKKILIIPIFILLLASLLNAQDLVTVKRVADGDALVLNNDERVRLIDIDAPDREMKKIKGVTK